jgi:DNA-binding CsgD family transcriptional regulator
MVHFLLFYRIILYSFGFGILVTAVFKYISTGNPLLRSFLFFWASMTITAGAYVIDFYIIKNTDLGKHSYAYIIMQAGALLVSVSLPYFIHILFNIKNKTAVYIFLFICSPMFICILIPISQDWLEFFVDFIMITVILSNLYSFSVSLRCVIKLKEKIRKTEGIIFFITYIILFLLLIIIDIYPEDKESDFLIFPLFYACIGCFFTFLGYRELRERIPDTVHPDFIRKYKLTKRETEIILLLIDGIKYKTIADRLFISLNTVNTHIRHIYEKTKTSNKIELRNSIEYFNQV